MIDAQANFHQYGIEQHLICISTCGDLLILAHARPSQGISKNDDDVGHTHISLIANVTAYM